MRIPEGSPPWFPFTRDEARSAFGVILPPDAVEAALEDIFDVEHMGGAIADILVILLARQNDDAMSRAIEFRPDIEEKIRDARREGWALGDPVPFELAGAEGDRGEFTRDEIRRGLAVLGMAEEHLDDTVSDLFAEDPAGGFVFDEMLLSAIGSTSDECAVRVAHLLRESPDQTVARLARFEAAMREHGLRGP